ncbi:MAG: phosphodiester glycosidase family protein [Clostridia bacterium]|nr:phosphodiester glycosidase family protein [Clostridia bacterium]
MRNIRVKWLPLFLALFLLLSCVAEPSDLPEETPGTTAPPETEVPVEYFSLTSSTCLTRPTGAMSEELLGAVQLFNGVGKTLVEGGIMVADDWYRDVLERREVEILLGATNRPESAAALSELSYYDYMYEVVSPNVVVICGGCDETTHLAAARFLSDCYGYTGEGTGALKDIPVGTSYVYRHAYALQAMTLCGKPLSGYSIVCAEGASMRAGAELLRGEISRLCGSNLPILTADAYTGGDAILFGMGALDGSHLFESYGKYGYAVQYRKSGADNLVAIDMTASIEKAATAFANTMLTVTPGDEAPNVQLSEQPQFAYSCVDEMNGLTLLNAKEETIADGVVYSRRNYTDRDGKPVIAYVIEADLQKVEVLNATPDFGEIASGVKATTLEAMQAAAKAGYRVYAGVNANFFHIDSDYSPSGLCIKDGKRLSSVGSRPWVGITEDGAAVVGESADYSRYAGKLTQAFSGSDVILRDGVIHDVDYGNSMGYTRHPRTAVGVKTDGGLLLIVVDGRQARLSNGASLGDLALILLELGATDAINLDGGGSSSIVTSAEADRYVVRNSPSDGKLRSVYNSLVLAAKP